MSKETMIVFVYDNECLKEEADDPVSAVLYFHPSWVSDTQKVALCGQLMGTAYFLKDCFFKPRILALQNGKFVLKEFGRFTLAVGTDRNISDFLLEHRADLLSALIKLYHRDLQTIYDQFAQQAQYKNLTDKLYHIFETYLPILQRNGNIFQNVPRLRIPKTASNIFLEAIQTLQCCQQTKGILGGAILYHNKIVASQLSYSVTKQLVLTEPRHIRTTAELLNAQNFHIPNGVQMIVVYIDLKQYTRLVAEAQRAQNLQTTNLSAGALPFQYVKRKMKRDKSLIFTHIPEEGSNATSGASDILPELKTENMPIRPKSLRPTHLPLRLKSLNNKELPESGIASINFDETDSYPEFIGRTSVCSTPMAENKVLPVANIMSICAHPEDEFNSNDKTQNRLRTTLKSDFEKFFQNFITNPNKDMTRRKSFTDLQDSLKKISKKLSIKQISQNFKTDVNRNGSNSPDYIENDDDIDENSSDSSSTEQTKTSQTITDPTYPVFNANGQPISRSLFQEFLDKYYKIWGDAKEKANEDAEIAALVEEFQEFDNELKKLDEYMRQESKINGDGGDSKKSQEADSNLNVAAIKTPMDKKSMNLPLKPLTGDMTGQVPRRKQTTGGVPLTPLMAKLSVLALSDAANATSAIEIQTPLNTTTKSFTRRNSLKCDDAVDALAACSLNPTTSGGTTANSDGLQRTELYVCGQQNMTLLLLMEEGASNQQHIVQKLFDICVAKFPQMESQLNQTLNVNVEGDKREGSYSFMCVDAKWDALQSNGPWNPMELNTIESMHRDLRAHDADVTDLVLRSHDTVFYGYKSGRTEFFYKEPAHQVNGIPPPSDPMGNISMRAKMRLERDHSYMLF